MLAGHPDLHPLAGAGLVLSPMPWGTPPSVSVGPPHAVLLGAASPGLSLGPGCAVRHGPQNRTWGVGHRGCSPGWGEGSRLFLQGAGSPHSREGDTCSARQMCSRRGHMLCQALAGCMKGHRWHCWGRGTQRVSCLQLQRGGRQNRSGARQNQHQPCTRPVSLAGRTLGTSLLPRAVGMWSRVTARGWRRS